jgi:hypothetical protein
MCRRLRTSRRGLWMVWGTVGTLLFPAVGWGQGLSGRVGNFRWSLGISGSQGSSQTLGLHAPSVVLPQGGMGFVGSSIHTPFVTGVMPVVGDVGYSPVQIRWQRLQRERARAALSRQVDSPELQSDPPVALPPATPAAVPGHRRVDDPPLVLGKP